MPGDIPAQLNVDISGLIDIDQGIRLAEVPLPERVTLATGVDPDELVLKVAQVRVAAEPEEVEAAAAEGEEAEAAEEPPATSPGRTPSGPDSGVGHRCLPALMRGEMIAAASTCDTPIGSTSSATRSSPTTRAG